MKILVISDSHGRNGRMELVIEQESPLDLIIHLGDLEGGEDLLEAIAPCPVEMVCGNNDLFSLYPREKIIDVGGVRVFMCHGHNYGVSAGTQRLAQAALQHQCSLAMFGHTHCPVVEEEQGITVVNPGSISYPRQANRKPSYIIMNVEPGKKPEFTVYYMTGSPGNSMGWG